MSPRPYRIYRIDCLAFAGDTLTLRVACSKGNLYSGCWLPISGRPWLVGAHLAALRRTAVGNLFGWSFQPLPILNRWMRPKIGSPVPVDALLSSLPGSIWHRLILAGAFRHGNPVPLPLGLAGKIRVYADERLIGVGEPGNAGSPVAEKTGAAGDLGLI